MVYNSDDTKVVKKTDNRPAAELQFIVSPLQVNKSFIQIMNELPKEGILCQSDTGYVYLKVSDEFIYKLFPLIEVSGFEIPPYFSGDKNVGAHITIIYPDELTENIIIDGKGKTIQFELEEIYSASLGQRQYVKILIKSQILENIRKQCGLGLKPVYHGIEVNFHITIAWGRV